MQCNTILVAVPRGLRYLWLQCTKQSSCCCACSCESSAPRCQLRPAPYQTASGRVSVPMPCSLMLGATALAVAAACAIALPLTLRAAPEPPPPRILKYTVVRELPHDPRAFTQGLQLDTHENRTIFWESTGMYGQSEVREVDVETGKVRRALRLPRQYFGEGITRVGDRLLQLTWRQGTLLEYADVATFHAADAANFTAGVAARDTGLADGWGITYDGTHVLITDSTVDLRWFEPGTLQEVRRAVIRDGSAAVPWANELEWAEGQLWANVWQTNCVARIDPATARVTAWLQLGALTARTREANAALRAPMDVLNGIAYDAAAGTFYVTGKYWSRMYEIEVAEEAREASAEELSDVRRACIPRVHGLGL